jgi:hypothetical protein
MKPMLSIICLAVLIVLALVAGRVAHETREHPQDYVKEVETPHAYCVIFDNSRISCVAKAGA